jgi:hypothetical protein
MAAFKTCLLAAATVLGVMTSSLAETQMEQVRSWLSQLAPQLDMRSQCQRPGVHAAQS